MPRREGRLSGKRWNRLKDTIVARYNEQVDTLVEKYNADGYPPGAEPLSPIEQMHQLRAWQQAGDPKFWQNPEAQAALAQLEARFGGGPRIQPPGISNALLAGTAALSHPGPRRRF